MRRGDKVGAGRATRGLAVRAYRERPVISELEAIHRATRKGSCKLKGTEKMYFWTGAWLGEQAQRTSSHSPTNCVFKGDVERQLATFSPR